MHCEYIHGPIGESVANTTYIINPVAKGSSVQTSCEQIQVHDKGYRYAIPIILPNDADELYEWFERTYKESVVSSCLSK